MEPNNLIVTVVAARGLSLKGHSKLEIFVSLTICGRGTWKSKVHTDVVRATNDCTWNQRCEFALNDLESTLSVAVNHKTVLGTSDCIGALELPLRQLMQVSMPMWYKLGKKGNCTPEAINKKYRGELMLHFEFATKAGIKASQQKLSTSSYSINTLDGSNKLETLKRKMRIGRKRSSHTASMASLDHYVCGREAALCADSLQRQQQLKPPNHGCLNADLTTDGLITPPVAASHSSIGSSVTHKANTLKNLAAIIGARSNDDTLSTCHSRNISISMASIPNWSSPSPIRDEVDRSEISETASAVIPRPRSVASSGFGSARSTLFNGHELTSPTQYQPQSYDELLKALNELRVELARKDAKIYDLQEYIDRLLVRIIERDPQLLDTS